jgi:16S rRNA (guanine966-N2)-methyltransferase
MKIIAGSHKGRNLSSPQTSILRPTTSRLRAAIFNICQLTVEGSSFLDLFAGLGAIGCEALSRGANYVTFVEQSKTAMNCIQKNIDHLQERKKADFLLMDAFSALALMEKQGLQFDIIYADPPYGKEGIFLSNKVLSILDNSSLLKEGGELFLEDDIEAKEEPLILKRLKLKSVRRVGRTSLRHFILT